MCRPDGDDAVDSGLALVAEVSCSMVSVVGNVGGFPEASYARLFIRSFISSVHMCVGVKVPFRISSLFGDGVHGGITVESG